MAVRLVKTPRPEPPAGFTPEQWAAIEARLAEERATTAGVLEVIYRAAVGVARLIKPEKRWDGL